MDINLEMDAFLAKFSEHERQLRQIEEGACLHAIGKFAGIEAIQLPAEELRKRATLHHWPDGTKTLFWDNTPLIRFIPSHKQEPVLRTDDNGLITVTFPGFAIERLYATT